MKQSNIEYREEKEQLVKTLLDLYTSYGFTLPNTAARKSLAAMVKAKEQLLVELIKGEDDECC